MNKLTKIIIVALLLIAVGSVIAIKKNTADDTTLQQVATETTQQTQVQTVDAAIPHLLDLGAGKCIPCRMMKPILEELTKDYEGRLRVTFIDVWENPDAGEKYGIHIIPTQIFYDAQGKELFRHEGFYSREEILAKFKEFGIELSPSQSTSSLTHEQAVASQQESP